MKPYRSNHQSFIFDRSVDDDWQLTDCLGEPLVTGPLVDNPPVDVASQGNSCSDPSKAVCERERLSGSSDDVPAASELPSPTMGHGWEWSDHAQAWVDAQAGIAIPKPPDSLRPELLGGDRAINHVDHLFIMQASAAAGRHIGDPEQAVKIFTQHYEHLQDQLRAHPHQDYAQDLNQQALALLNVASEAPHYKPQSLGHQVGLLMKEWKQTSAAQLREELAAGHHVTGWTGLIAIAAIGPMYDQLADSMSVGVATGEAWSRGSGLSAALVSDTGRALILAGTLSEIDQLTSSGQFLHQLGESADCNKHQTAKE